MLKRRRKSGLAESAVMILVALNRPMRAAEISDATGIYDRMFHWSVRDLQERGLLRWEGSFGSRFRSYSRTEAGDEFVVKAFQAVPAFHFNDQDSR